MNKLFTKIATAFVGIAMAIGVGVAIGSNSDVRRADAVDVTGQIKFGSASGSLNVNGASVSGDDSQSNEWTVTTVGTSSFTPNANYAQIGSSSKPASSITFTTTLSSSQTIKSMSAKFGGFSGTAGTITLKVGDSTIGTGSLSASSDVTVNSTDGSKSGTVLTVTVTGISKGVKAYYISYTYSESSKTLSSIAVTTAPTKTAYYVGDSFDSTGMVVTATYSDKSTANVTSSCTFTPDPFTATGAQNVTVSYTEGGTTETTTQAVTVSANTLSSISIADYTTTLAKGAAFSFGGTVTAHYASGSTNDVTASATFSGYNMASAGDQTVTVSYTESGTTKKATYTLSVVNLNVVEFVRGTDTGATSVTKSGVTATLSTMNDSRYYQIYAGESGTFTCEANILKIEFTCTASGTNKYGPGNTSADVGSYSYDGNTGTWTGSAKSVALTSTAQVRMLTLVVTTEALSIPASINGASNVNVGVEWTPTSITEDDGGATVTGATYSFAASGGAVISSSTPATGAFTCSAAGTVTVSATKDGWTIADKVVTVNSVEPYINLTLESSSEAYTGQTVTISASYGNGVTGLAWSVTSGAIIGTATTSNSGYSAKIGGETGTLTIKAQDTGNASTYATVDVTVTKTAFATSPSNASVGEGKTTTLSATLNSGGSISWSSSDNTVASVADGVVTGVSEGTATITAQSADDTRITASCTVTVTEAPAEVVITSSEIANFGSSYAERDWTYGTGTAAISGKIKAYKNGDNIQMNHNNTCYMYNVDAIPGYITGITFTKISGTTDITAWVGDEVLSSDPSEGGTTNTTYTWSFDASDKHSYFRVATSGSTGARVASAITISYQKISLVDPTSITINDKTEISMDTYGYGKRNLTATVGPINANDKTVTWGTSDPSVVTVSNGVLTPVGVGDATVYATTVNYVSDQETPDLKDSVSVHVTQALYKKATFSPTSTSTVTQSDDYLNDGSASISATDAGTWDNVKSAIQLASGKDVTFTVSGYAGMKITGIDMVVSSNGNAGAGSLSVTAGSTTVLSIPTATFADASWNGAYDANPVQLHRDITDYVVSGSETIVFSFAASVNSLYVHSVSVRYIDYSLEQWCETFLTIIACDGSDSITDDSGWGTLGSDFLELDEDLRGIAAGATANKDSDNVIEQAMARYDLILRKYGIGSTAGKHTDFIGRFGEGTINGKLAPHIGIMISKNTVNTSIIVIVTVGIAAIAIGGYFLLRKKKED